MGLQLAATESRMLRSAHYYRASNLLGLQILVVEPEFFAAAALSTYLRDSGAEVLDTAATLTEAGHLLDTEEFAGAILDIRLGRELVYPLADRLAREGIPFVLHSASFTALPCRFDSVPQVAKAEGFEAVATAILLAIVRCRAGLSDDEIDLSTTTDQVLRGLRAMARGLVGNALAADQIVEEALQRCVAQADAGRVYDDYPRMLADMVETIWLGQKLSRPT